MNQRQLLRRLAGLTGIEFQADMVQPLYDVTDTVILGEEGSIFTGRAVRSGSFGYLVTIDQQLDGGDVLRVQCGAETPNGSINIALEKLVGHNEEGAPSLKVGYAATRENGHWLFIDTNIDGQ
ncbi:MAG: hypothetical protein ABIH34_04115 [Nanoarchaeota archaeon]